MTFKKITDQDNIKLEEFKQKHGSTNLGSYRALLMRGTDPNQAIEIINKRSSLQPIAEAPPKAQPKKRTKKEEPAPAVEPEPVPMAIEDVKAPAPKPKPKKEKIKKEQFEKKKASDETSLDIVI